MSGPGPDDRTDSPVPAPPAPTGRRPLVLGLAAAGYLALSVLVWWHVWATHPTTVGICGCEDPSLFTWFLDWPAYAIAHGHDLFYSSALFHPVGVDLLSNTSVLAVGVPLAPVTWIWGPVAALNVASTLAPALSALSMCWLLLRWVRWAPAAVVGGLVFGFSPFVFTNLAGAHLMTAVLVLLPVTVACLDELLVRQGHRPGRVGVALGLCLALQFFVGTEVLTITLLLGAVGVLMVVVYAALGHRQALAERWPHAVRGVAVAGGVAVVLLAYPTWVALAGPAHLAGAVWPTIAPGTGGSALHGLWQVHFADAQIERYVGGYQGPGLPTPSYLGVGMLVVLGAGVLAWRRDRRLWCFGALGLVSVALALGNQRYWTPWRLFTRVPLIQQVIPARVMAVGVLCAAVMVGVIVDRTYASTRAALARAAGRRARLLPAVTAGALALAVAALAVEPMASAVHGNVPLTTQTVSVPRWFSEVAPSLPPGRVVLTFPLPGAGEGSLAWQAVDDLHYALATGAGPDTVAQRAGRERRAQEVLTSAEVLFPKLAPPTPGPVYAVRRALGGWGVTDIVVTDPATLRPPATRRAATAWALGYFTLAVGRTPRRQDGAWVWGRVGSPDAVRRIGPAVFAACTAPPRLKAGELAVPDCVLQHSVPAHPG